MLLPVSHETIGEEAVLVVYDDLNTDRSDSTPWPSNGSNTESFAPISFENRTTSPCSNVVVPTYDTLGSRTFS